MPGRLSPRLAAVVDALPLAPGARVLEIGCGPGAAAREIARRLEGGHVVALDRSPAAVALARAGGAAEIAAGRLSVRLGEAETFALEPGEPPFDLVLAVRVGALDGRHPEAGRRVLANLRTVLAPGARVLVDGGDPLRELVLP
ncbi:SAM-dependent methyltransferase [Kineococcus sp. SYSU DK004]|uniref:SAM-dependent methyltransferase n=1 Tax=Kineococcus sp. SYSU DK004 TaxID=3383125 RepID=UPI003D7EAC27